MFSSVTGIAPWTIAFLFAFAAIDRAASAGFRFCTNIYINSMPMLNFPCEGHFGVFLFARSFSARSALAEIKY